MLDGLFDYVQDKKVSNEKILRLQKILKDEEYDSNAVEMDIFNTENNKDSNIRKWINNDAESQLFQQYIHRIKLIHFIISSFHHFIHFIISLINSLCQLF